MTAVAASFAEVFSSALRGEPCEVVDTSGAFRPLPVSTWRQSVDPSDVSVLARCVGPTIDIGCGPGRMAQGLADRGHVVLGIDVVPEAVFQTRDRGVSALLRDVFDALPGEGRWDTALLADGNIGIGGAPVRLLRRTAELIRPSGRVVVDVEPPGSGVETRTVRLRTLSRTCRPFPWSLVGTDAIGRVAAASGLTLETTYRHDDRWFAVLRKDH